MLGALAVAAVTAGAAEARSYEVSSCVDGSSASPFEGGWQAELSTAGGAGYAECPAEPGNFTFSGLIARHSAGPGTHPQNTTGILRLDAPAGTLITRIRGDFEARAAKGWKTGLYNPGESRWELVNSTATDSTSNWPGMEIWGLSTNRLELLATCTSSAGCARDQVYGYSDAKNVHVTIEDAQAPQITNGRGLWGATGWLRGSHNVGLDASDNAGVKNLYAEIDGAARARRDFGCNYARIVPCATGRQSTDAAIDTAGLADGAHKLRLVAHDTAGNPAMTGEYTFQTDNTAPDKPTISKRITENGNGWTNADQVRFTYPKPASVSPLAKTDVQLCDAAAACVTQAGVGDGSGDDSTVLPKEGVFTVQARVHDAAGNVGGFGDKVTVKYDRTPPGEASVTEANGWIGRKEAVDYLQRIEGLQSGEWEPVSGLAGFAVTTDGSTPGTVVTPGMEGRAPAMTIARLDEGVTTVRARAVSNAGLAGPVGSAEIRVDLTDPTVALSGTASETQWQRGAVNLAIRGTDPSPAGGAAASGMAPSKDVDHTLGGYVEYSLDGREWKAVKGDEAVVTAGDGEHRLAYRAFDVAGNASETKTATFKIDSTAPAPVAFELPGAEDPQKVTLIAHDATSGVRWGQVQMLDLDTGGGWVDLGGPLSPRADGRMVTSTKGADAGRYRLRAVVADHAGNVTVAEKTVAGGSYDVVVPDRDGGGPVASLPGDGRTPPLESGSGYVGGDVGNGHSGKGNPNGTQTQVISGLVRRAKVRSCPKPGTSRRSRQAAARCRKALARARACPKPGRTRRSKDLAVSCEEDRRRQAVARRGEQVVETLKVAYGRTAILRGRVTTLAGGKAIAGGEVAVWAELKSAWGSRGRREFKNIATVGTDSRGVFAYRVPKGATRIIRAEYVGDARTADSWRDQLVRVPTGLSIRADRTSLRNGQAVRLSGTVSRPVPATGKIVTVQAHDGRRWLTIANTRASSKGLWRHGYRFTRTTGTHTYRFRVKSPAEAPYAYDSGTSKPVAVRVRG